MATEITISEGIQNLKLLKERYSELVTLRNQNSGRETRYFGATADKSRDIVPVYDVKALDRQVVRVAAEIRKLDASIKRANATTLVDYLWDDSVLGSVE